MNLALHSTGKWAPPSATAHLAPWNTLLDVLGLLPPSDTNASRLHQSFGNSIYANNFRIGVFGAFSRFLLKTVSSLQESIHREYLHRLADRLKRQQ
jgi:hypothetical protein